MTEGRLVRDVCPLAAAQGVARGVSVIHARRLCPLLLAVSVDAVEHRALTTSLLDALADWSGTVEPDGPDAAFALLDGAVLDDAVRSLPGRLRAALGLTPVIGLGGSKLAARACAECDLPPDRLADASVDWLWPEDTAVVAALRRLGLDAFGQVAAVGEGALFYRFGRIGRLLHRRAQGQDLTPVRALYPPPRAEAALNLSEHPLNDQRALLTALARVCRDAARQLRQSGRHGRRLVLAVDTERGTARREWVLPVPVQSDGEVLAAARRVLGQTPVDAPVTGLRLTVEDLDAATARTPTLFAEEARGDEATLGAVRRLLAARYGLRGLTTLGQRPLSVRERRRAVLADRWRAAS